MGWNAIAALQPLDRLAIDAEWSSAGSIEDVRTTTLDVNGRHVMIQSSFTHSTQSLTLLGGYTHRLSSRARLAYLFGGGMTKVRRRFTTSAPALILVPPSDRTAAGSSESSVRFASFAGGVDGFVRIAGRLQLLGGVRLQNLPLASDFSGSGMRLFAGAGWAF